MPSRREFILQATTAAAMVASRSVRSDPREKEMMTRVIPGSGEAVPVIGMGTSGSFEVRPGSAEYEALRDVLAVFFEGGGRLIDTAPTYSNAEDVLGDLMTDEQRRQVFLATKLSGVRGRDAGRAQFAGTLRRLGMERVDLLQVHNLRDTATQLAVARELRDEGKVRYVGVTHYVDSAHDELADVVEKEKPDFLQINYSVIATGAEKRVFPVAQEHGVAVLTNRNFNDGRLFRQVAGRPVPDWAAEVGATSWAQLFLKFALSHPAVTAVIPATGKPHRQADNLGAGSGGLLDATQRRALLAEFD
ncbi:aldo/keto reductase [Elongatibacter sediminis]|uniref:Aldo/keto reductase n=1 Tax=Elongatibacter sediminis TaxID=3119006 RepID=A0AAW9RC96_9GAMM